MSRHAFRRGCLELALAAEITLAEAGPDALIMRAERLRVLADLVEGGWCPRCGGDRVAQVGSLATGCGCVPVCGACGRDERERAVWLASWPLRRQA